MIDTFQRHPTEADCVILHVSGIMANLSTGETIEVRDQAYRDALEAANADSEHPFFGKLVD